MAQPSTTKDPQAFLNALAGLSQLESTKQISRKKRYKKRKWTSKNEKPFLNALIDFRRHGYKGTWSTNGSWIVLELYGESLSFNGFQAATKALLDRIEQWNNE